MWQQIIYSLAFFILYIVFKNLESSQNRVKFYTRVFVIFLCCTIVTIIVCPLLIIYKKRNLRIPTFIQKCGVRVASLFGMQWHWQLENEEWLAGEDGAVIISNHQSSLDGVGMFIAWPKINRIVAVMKKELWLLGLMALGAYLGGAAVFIDRRNPKKAYQSLESTKRALVKDGARIWVFPEGTRNTGNKVKLLPFKKGAFSLAIAAQVPIIPIVYSPQYFVNEKKCIWYNDGKVIMRCLEPVPTKGLTLEDVSELQERLHKIMLEAFKKLSKEILNDLPIHTKLATEILP